MFTCADSVSQKEPLNGIFLKTMTWGDLMMLVRFDLKAGSRVPEHAHPHEQIGYLVEGSLQLCIGAETVTARPGDSWCIPAHTKHSATAESDCVAIEVFSPVRKDYLP